MKKLITLSALLCMVLSMSGCSLIKSVLTTETEDDDSFSEDIIVEEYPDYSFEDDEEYTFEDDNSFSEYFTVDYNENISFEINSDFEVVDEEKNVFRDEDTGIVYVLQGNTPLMDYEPEDYYSALLEDYNEKYNVIENDDNLEQVYLKDGTEAFVANMKLQNDGAYNIIDLLIIPNKNETISYSAMYNEDIYIEDTCLREITLSTEINTGTQDLISGNNFTLSDNSMLCFEDTGDFIYYKDGSDTDGSYMSGTYEVYYGQEATDKLVSLEEYGLTEEELERTLKANMRGYTLSEDKTIIQDSSATTYHICKDNFYAVVLHNEKIFDNGVEEEMTNDVVYLGYYIYEEGFFDMLNCNSYNYSLWK